MKYQPADFLEEFTNQAKPDFLVSSYKLGDRYLIAVGDDATVFDEAQALSLVKELTYHIERIKKYKVAALL